MHVRDVIIAPVISEKTHALIDENKYSFRVAPDATKIQIRDAVERIFKVGVTDVNVMNKRGKRKTMGKFAGKTSTWKKAIVTVKKGQKIAQFFEGM
jgi:large subunit ribosomal protein L23